MPRDKDGNFNTSPAATHVGTRDFAQHLTNEPLQALDFLPPSAVSHSHPEATTGLGVVESRPLRERLTGPFVISAFRHVIPCPTNAEGCSAEEGAAPITSVAVVHLWQGH